MHPNVSRLHACLPLLALVMVAAPSLPAHAQDDAIVRPGAVVYSGPSGITVAGHGEIKVMPDIALASLTVETTDRSESKAVSGNAAKMQAVMSALNGSNVAQKDIQNTSYYVATNRNYDANPPVLTGYTVTNSIAVTLRDISKSGVIIDKVTTVGATVDGVSFDLADKDRVQGEALVAACANARSNADLMAGASGVSLGRVLMINQQGAVAPPVFAPMMARNTSFAGAAAAPQTSVSPQEVTITADITATYAINYSQK